MGLIWLINGLIGVNKVLLVQLGLIWLMGIVQLGLMGITWYNYDCKSQLHNCFDFQF